MSNNYNRLPSFSATVNNIHCLVIADTGSMPATVISSNAPFLNDLEIKKSNKKICTADGENFDILGEVDFELKILENLTLNLENVAILKKLNFDIIVGFPTLSNLGLPEISIGEISPNQKVQLEKSFDSRKQSFYSYQIRFRVYSWFQIRY